MEDFINSLMYEYEVNKELAENLQDLKELLNDAYSKNHYEEIEKEIKKIEEQELTGDEKYVVESFKNEVENKKSKQYFEDSDF